jgi:ACS family D-galactonate transporter-like MFS transporter
MGQTGSTDAPKLTARHWGLLVLLIVSVQINYFDRGSLSITAPLISTELALSPARMGVLLSSFFWTYAFALVAAGWLVDRYGVKWVLGLGFLVWTLATLGTGYIRSFLALLGMRMLLGIGESVAYPAYSNVFVNRFPAQKWGLVNALIDTGAKFGQGVGVFIGGLLLAGFGWRALFKILGAVGLLWLGPWFKWAPQASTSMSPRDRGPGIMQILKQPKAHGTILGEFCANYSWYFLLTWLPTYLVTERHYPIRGMIIWASLPFLANAAGSLFGGWLSDRWIAGGWDSAIVRLAFVVIGLLACGLVLPAALLPNRALAVASLPISFFAFGLYASNLWPVTQTLAGPKAAGSWTGIQNSIANFPGILSPYLTGLIVSRTGSFKLAFLTSAFVLVCGAAAYLFIVRRVEPVTWKPQFGTLAE